MMRDSSLNHSDPIPDAENWILVSDPFERPKVYRHKHSVFKAPSEEGGVYVFVIAVSGLPPLLLHDINELRPREHLWPNHMSSYVAPIFRLNIGGEPIEIASVYPIPPSNADGFLALTSHERNYAPLKEIPMMRNLGLELAFRLKVETQANANFQKANPRSFRGNLDAEGTLALSQAVILFDHFQESPK
jgi:hypothetical protein